MIEIKIDQETEKPKYIRGHRGRDRMVVGFTATYAISGNH
jgi:hypothetical protein